MNYDETGVDCGGSCSVCPVASSSGSGSGGSGGGGGATTSDNKNLTGPIHQALENKTLGDFRDD
jgi:hypothetical protein